MATLYIDQFQLAGNNGFNTVQAPLQPPLVATTALSVSGTSAATSFLNEKTTLVRLQADTNCFVIFGTNPTAITSSSTPLSVGTPEYFAVPAGGTLKIAAIL